MINRRGTYVVIEGIDGSGKTTLFEGLLSRIKSEGQFSCSTICPTRVQRPNSLVERLFRQIAFVNRSRFLRAFVFALRSREAVKSTNWDASLILGDRSLITSYTTRWRMFFSMPRICVWFADMLEPTIPSPDFVLFLSIDPLTAQQRIRDRNQYTSVDETLQRSRELALAYKEVCSYPIPRIQRTKWIWIDGDLDTSNLLDTAWPKLQEIMKSGNDEVGIEKASLPTELPPYSNDFETRVTGLQQKGGIAYRDMNTSLDSIRDLFFRLLEESDRVDQPQRFLLRYEALFRVVDAALWHRGYTYADAPHATTRAIFFTLFPTAPKVDLDSIVEARHRAKYDKVVPLVGVLDDLELLLRYGRQKLGWQEGYGQ